MVRPERFELPAFWFVARRSIQLSYGRILFRCVSQQLTAGSAFCTTATLGRSKSEVAKEPFLYFLYFRARNRAVNLVKRLPEASCFEEEVASAVSFTFRMAPGGKGIRMSCPAAR